MHGHRRLAQGVEIADDLFGPAEGGRGGDGASIIGVAAGLIAPRLLERSAPPTLVGEGQGRGHSDAFACSRDDCDLAVEEVEIALDELGRIENILERNIGITKYFSYIVIKSPIVKMYYPLVKLFGTARGQD